MLSEGKEMLHKEQKSLFMGQARINSEQIFFSSSSSFFVFNYIP